MAVGVRARVEVPLGVTMEDFSAVGITAGAPPQPFATKMRGTKMISATMA